MKCDAIMHAQTTVSNGIITVPPHDLLTEHLLVPQPGRSYTVELVRLQSNLTTEVSV
jgi:hypothetical protein